MKPDLDNLFAVMPFIGAYLKADYDKVTVLDEAVDLIHKWANEAERTQNQIKRACYLKASQTLTNLILQ